MTAEPDAKSDTTSDGQPRFDLVTSERLELPLLAEAHLEELAAGRSARVAADLDAVISPEWVDGVQRWAGFRLNQVREVPADKPWLLRAIVERRSRVAIGYFNFHQAPDDRGVPEAGYTVLPEYRRRGYAIEAIGAMFDWAARTYGVRRFRASIAPDNEPSLALIDRLGFEQVGDQWDEEDGLELIFEGDWPPAAAIRPSSK